MNFTIKPINKDIINELKDIIDNKTKPIGSLGKLEDLAIQIGQIQNTIHPDLVNPHMLVFAGDHGIAQEGVSPYPQDVTYQMVLNFLNGGAAINVFCRQNNISIKIIDAGVKNSFEPDQNLINAKIGNSTNNFLKEPAMSKEQCKKAFFKGGEIINSLYNNKCNIVGFGEMGIGNTSSASVIMSSICNIEIAQCVGKGTGLDEKGLLNKIKILDQAIKKHNIGNDPLLILETFGGFEIAMMCGAMLKAAENNMILLIDGFISTSALLIASKINSQILDYCIFCHLSDEKGHKQMLNYLNKEPVLNISMRLGEGTGAAVAYPIIKSAVLFLNEMASFKSANVSREKDD